MLHISAQAKVYVTACRISDLFVALSHLLLTTTDAGVPLNRNNGFGIFITLQCSVLKL